MKIAMIASEANPFVKTGGLADVTYALSKELVTMGEEVVLFLPLYKTFREKVLSSIEQVARVEVKMAWRKNFANIYRIVQDGITYYFVENYQYFERDAVYGYGDDGERFAFFVSAVYKALPKINFEADVIHVHDWQTAMFPCLAKELKEDFYKKTKYVLTIHNPAFKGMLKKEALGNLFNLSEEIFNNGKTRFEGNVSTLKCGIVYADKINTVSPNHRLELLSKEGGMGLNEVLKYRRYDFFGILNGIDYVEFNPSDDRYIKENFDSTNVFDKKILLKQSVARRYALAIAGRPLFAIVTRLTWQKGFDIMIPVIEHLASEGYSFIIVGSGEYEIESKLQSLANRYSRNIALYLGYSNELAHLAYAASDFFLMPSLFEPCGLGQMIAERYGSLPIVRGVGGLRDSVIKYVGTNAKKANGFAFDDYKIEALYNTILYAIETYKDKNTFKQIVLNALETDNSWAKSANEYIGIYKTLKIK